MRKCALLLGLWLAPTAAPACTLKGLAWMQGTWRGTAAIPVSEERWVVGPDDILIGSSWVMAPGKPPFIEAMTISADGPAIALRLRHFSRNLAHAMEDQDAPMLFTLASCRASTAVFDGQGPRPASTSPIAAPASACCSPATSYARANPCASKSRCKSPGHSALQPCQLNVSKPSGASRIKPSFGPGARRCLFAQAAAVQTCCR